MKIWTLSPNEDWICDRMVAEWNHDNSDISTNDIHNADIIWLLADWCWQQVPVSILGEKIVVTTVHHIVPEKFNRAEKFNFELRDKFTDYYHVYNEYTYNFIRSLTTKPIKLIPYWANQNIWKISKETKFELRKKYNLPTEKDVTIFGSFQRDTEGFDLQSPKLEKGPDILADYLISRSEKSNIHVLLAGWRRQYIINRLKQASISFTYKKRPSQEILNELYQTLDIYPISARVEGGPQALIECGLLNVPVVSRKVGIANQVLPQFSISNNLEDAVASVPDVQHMTLPQGYKPYRGFFQSL